MIKSGNFFRLIVAGLLCLALALGAVPEVRASVDVALFYAELAPYGNWIDYGNYGPVWYPTRVPRNWRPYVNGRWTPTAEGWIFESPEPWAWATYHYGNWMPTTRYGWVWCPGSTWYPATAAWRTSDDYVGWAPIPPPEYVPEPAFYPAGGYTPETPFMDLITEPFWIFAQAANFLLGFEQPYAPVYSYYSCDYCLAPYDYNPVVYDGTFLLTDFYYPYYAPGAFYCFGPPFAFVSRITNINVAQINNFANNVDLRTLHNSLPPEKVLARRPFLRDAIPEPLRTGKGFEVARVSDVGRAERQLNHPGIVPPPGNVPQVTKRFPKAAPATGPAPKNLKAVKGMSLPPKAQQKITTQMRQQIQAERVKQPSGRVETKPEFRHPGRPEFHPKPGQPGRVAPVPEFRPAPSREVKPAPRPEMKPAPRREVAPAPRREVAPAPKREVAPVPRREVAPAPEREIVPTPRREVAPAPRPEIAPAPPSAPRQAPMEFQHVPHPTFQAPAPAPHAAPAPSFKGPAPAARPSAPAPSAPRSAPAPGAGGKPEEHH